MQFPMLFKNATEVYNHLFYVIGNGYDWKDGELKEVGFRPKSKLQCIKDVFNEHVDDCVKQVKSLEEMLSDGRLDRELDEKLIINRYKHCAEDILEEINVIMTADERADDFSIPKDIFPYIHEVKFEFYPISESSKCKQIPDDVKPDWKEGIEKINKIREEYESKTKNNDNTGVN